MLQRTKDNLLYSFGAAACFTTLVMICLPSKLYEEEDRSFIGVANAAEPAEESAGSEALAPVSEAAWEDASGEVETDEDVRTVVSGMRSAGDDRREELRSRALHSNDPLVAGNSIKALGRLGLIARDPEIQALLESSQARTREEVVTALGDSDDPRVAFALLPLLGEEDENLRLLTMESLGKLGGGQARAALERVARDKLKSETERAHARAALAVMEANSANQQPPVSILVDAPESDAQEPPAPADCAPPITSPDDD